MNTKKLLREKIYSDFEKLEEKEMGTEEYLNSIDGLTKLVDREIEFERQEEAKRDRYIRNGITVGSLLLSVGVTIWGARATWKFEETGTIGSQVGREFINKILRFKL